MVSPCIHCACLGKKYIKSKGSDRCSEYIKEGCTHYVELKPSFTNVE
jgi:hypothetical protein